MNAVTRARGPGRGRGPTALLALGVVCAGFALAIPAALRAHQDSTHTEIERQHARGAFDVKITPLALDGPSDDETLGRLSIEKEYRGGLVATGMGQMLTAQTAVEGSAAYVAIERVSGTLDGRRGSFALQHRGTMTRGAPDLAVTVVPDSGTDELEGLAGTLQITIDGDAHGYDLEYVLPAR